MPTSTTVASQSITATKTDMTVTGSRFGYQMVSEISGDKTTFWAVDLIQEDDDQKGAFIHVYTATGTGGLTSKGTITLPAVTEKNTSWKKNTHRPLVAISITNLRIHGDHIWAADFQNGTIYRFNKSAIAGSADIIFFKPTTGDNNPYQFGDIAFQPKSGEQSADRLWVGDGNQRTSNIYSIDLPQGFTGSYTTPVEKLTPSDMSTVTSDSPVEFNELVWAKDKLWILTVDVSSAPRDDAFGIIYGATHATDGNLHTAKFISVPKAYTTVLDSKEGKEQLYVGTTEGSLYKIDLNAGSPAAVQIHNSTPAFAHARMSLDQAGYIWSTDISGKEVKCYSPLGTLSRQYAVTATGLTEPSWGSTGILHDGKRIALVDVGSKSLGLFEVDEAFILGDFDLVFDPAKMAKDTGTAVTTLPLQAREHGRTNPYSKKTSATLTEKDNKEGKTFPLGNPQAVEISVNAKTVTLAAPVTTGADEGPATVTAEARTTGTTPATLQVNVQKSKPEIIPDKNDKANNHANINGGFDVRQGKTTPLPDVKITAGPGPSTVKINNKDGTDSKFKDGTGANKTQKDITDANGKPIPDIDGGKKAGNADITVTHDGKTSTPVPIHILPLADTVGYSAATVGVNASQVLHIINTQMELITKGRTTLGSTSKSDEVNAPKTLISIKIVSNGNALHLVDKNAVKKPSDMVYRLSNEKGEVAFTQGDLQIAYESGHSSFNPRTSHLEVRFDKSGQMADAPTKADWSEPVQIKLPVR